MYSSALSVTSSLDREFGQRHAPAALPPGKTLYRCTGGWVGPSAGLDGCGKSRLHRDRSPDRLARSEWLYRLSYPGPNQMKYCYGNKRSSDALCGRKVSCTLSEQLT